MLWKSDGRQLVLYSIHTSSKGHRMGFLYNGSLPHCEIFSGMNAGSPHRERTKVGDFG